MYKKYVKYNMTICQIEIPIINDNLQQTNSDILDQNVKLRLKLYFQLKSQMRNRNDIWH